VLNKADLLSTPEALDAIMSFVRDSCKRLLGFQPEIFPLSALQAQQSFSAIGHDAIDLWESSRFAALENYLFTTLDEKERVRLKLLSPLGVMQRLLEEGRSAVEQRAALLAEDARTVENIEQQLQLYQVDMKENFTHRLGEIENIVLEMRERGDRFFDETIRFGRIFDLMQGQRIRAAFDSTVISDSGQRIDETVQELIDWLVEHEHRLWQDIMEYLERRRQVSARRDEEMVGSVSRQFDYNRRTLLQSVARAASNVVKTYDEKAEAATLSQELRSAVTLAATASAGGIGLGAAIVALVGTLAADVTGILAGSVLLALGLYVIPAQRSRAKRSFDEKMNELRARLRDAMNDQFNKELGHAIDRVRDALAPYTRFVRAEQQKADETQALVDHLNAEIIDMQREIEKIG